MRLLLRRSYFVISNGRSVEFPQRLCQEVPDREMLNGSVRFTEECPSYAYLIVRRTIREMKKRGSECGVKHR